jgi:hypothetical protein
MINIKFIVLSCDKYLNSRCKAQRDSFLKNEKRIFLTDSSSFNGDDIIGYDTPQNYEGIQDKYISFFKNYSFDDSDYFFCIDDDTFVNLKNLNKLTLPDSNIPFCLHRICYLDQDAKDYHGNFTGYPLYKITGVETQLPLMYPSGGSGFILSKSACLNIQNFLNSTADSEIPRSAHGDVSIGFWMRSAKVSLIQTDLFWFDMPEKLYNHPFVDFGTEDESKSITFHYVSEDNMFVLNNEYNYL